MRQRALWSLLLVVLFGYAGLTHADESLRAAEVDVQLEAWQLEAAIPMAEAALHDSPNDAYALYAMGRVRFYQGSYKEAVDFLERAIKEVGTAPNSWKDSLSLAVSTQEATKDLLEWKSPKGHFLFRYAPRDEVLLPYAAMAMDAAYDTLGADFDLYPSQVIPIEFYGSAEELAKVSTLTVDEIKTSGTIALCKFNRLMVTSPRALLQGYDWLDTITHEYTHYLISTKSHNTVPIWLHEGLAKYHEQRWRGLEKGVLPPSEEQILFEALKRGHLITFEQMHPSMAKLPSQDDAALAYAEVFMAVEYMKGKAGAKGIRDLLLSLRDGKTVEEGVSAVMGVPFADFLTDWTKYMKSRHLEDRPGLLPRKLVFKTESTPKEEPAETSAHAMATDTQKYFRLGELLLKEGKSRAAITELEKAKKLDHSFGMSLPMKLARAYLSSGLYSSAATNAEAVTALYPEYVGGWLVAGRALLAKEDFTAAKRNLEEAVWLNPFDPDAHKDLKRACLGLKDTTCSTQEEKAISLLK